MVAPTPTPPAACRVPGVKGAPLVAVGAGWSEASQGAKLGEAEANLSRARPRWALAGWRVAVAAVAAVVVSLWPRDASTIQGESSR